VSNELKTQIVSEPSLQAWTQSVGDFGCNRTGYHAITTQATFPIATLFAQNVAAVGFAVFGFPAGRNFEPLLHPFVCFLLRHDCHRQNFKTPLGRITI